MKNYKELSSYEMLIRKTFNNLDAIENLKQLNAYDIVTSTNPS